MPGRKIKNPEVKILKIKNPKENLVEIKNPASKPVKIKKPAQKRKRVTKESPSNNEVFYIKEIIQNYPTKASCHAEVELYKVSWLGYGKRHDSYEPASGIFQDVPLMIKKYWEGKVKDKKLKIKKIKDKKVKTHKVGDQKVEFGNNVDIRTKIVAKRKSKNSEKEEKIGKNEKVEKIEKVEGIKKTEPKSGSGSARSTRSSQLTTAFKPTEIPKKLRAFNSSPKIAAQHSQEVKDKMNHWPTGLNRSARSTRSKKINSPIAEKLQCFQKKNDFFFICVSKNCIFERILLPKNLRPFNLSPSTVSNQKKLATDNNESGINIINDEFNDEFNDDLNLSSLSLVDDVFYSTHPSNSPTDQYLSPATTLRCSTSTCSTSELLKTPVLIAPPSCFASPSKSPSESPIGSPIHSLRIVESEVGDECDSEFSQIQGVFWNVGFRGTKCEI